MRRLLLFVLWTSVWMACANKKTDTASKIEVTQGISAIYGIDKATSSVDFQFSLDATPIRFSTPLAAGRFSILDGLLATGDFELDMLDWKNTSAQTKLPFLLDTLKSNAAFDVANFQHIRFNINKVETKVDSLGNTHLLTCEIKVKNIITSIQLPTQIRLHDNQCIIQSNNIVFPIEEFGILNQYNKKSAKFRLQINAIKLE
jgi:polyisoprenoid-binding protein YceI